LVRCSATGFLKSRAGKSIAFGRLIFFRDRKPIVQRILADVEKFLASEPHGMHFRES